MSGAEEKTLPAAGAASEAAILPDGARVGRYTVLHALGSGAMGIVYAAYDPDLDRKVALKLVRVGDGSSGAGQSRGRVLREAKAIARLAHPNVVAVHDVGTYRDEVFIAMEHVDGGTLRDAIALGDRGWRELFDLYLQAGEGLAAAHASGLVHRDFKPDNVLLGADGRPRVCDFGLARPAAYEDERAMISPMAVAADAFAATMSRTGAIVGTPAYMAPEQLRGERADERSDEFSFCVALYEALYGQRPFEGRTLLELHERVDRGELRAPPASSPVPRWIFEVLARGLRRDPAQRWSSMRALLDALRRPPRDDRPGVATIGAVALAIAAVVGAHAAARAMRTDAPEPDASARAIAAAPPPPFAPQNFRRITFDDGCEEFPSFTPDGKSVVYDGAIGADSALFVLSLDDGAKRQLTGVHGWDFAASVSPDGARVAFLRSSPGESGTFVVPIDATPSEHPRFVTKGNLRPSWARDGRALWAGPHQRFTLRDVDDGRVLRDLAIPDGTIGGQSVELDDGRLAVTFPFIAEAARGAVGVYGKDDALRVLMDGNVGEVLALMPGGDRVIVARKLDSLVPVPFAVPLDGGEATPLGASGLVPRKGLAFSPDGRRVVYSTCRGQRSVLVVNERGDATPLSPGAEWEDIDVAAMPDSAALIVVSERSGRQQPWVVARDGTAPRAIAMGDVDPSDVAVSPDGRWLAAGVTPKGIRAIDLQAGGAPRVLTTVDTDQSVAFDASGERVLFTRDVGGKRVVMTVPLAGGDATALLEPGSRDASVAPDGRIAYLRGDDKELAPTIFDPRTRARAPLSRALPPGGYDRPQFSPDGKRVALVRAGAELIEVDAATGAIVRRFEHEGDQLSRVVYSGRDLVVLRSAWVGDLWSADLR